ncbi:helix-turn-helix domain-containing protein [Chondrinema litorale]|uniref:helix-turn-helix domain-containing protein n=1 Tax=Chondrinema litorale TaxID=2994555 RepID=UPI0025431559|nr:helix-turn-helix domain-containing protein [Chondrinema litorale]UZR96917.1 helix-turn-helix domain-containing protein [Chondrinema litorale]
MHPHIIMPSPQLRSVIQWYEYWDFNKTTNFSDKILALPSFENGIVFPIYTDKPIVIKNDVVNYESLPVTAIMPTLTLPSYNYNTINNRGIRVIFRKGAIAKTFNISMKSFQNLPLDSSYILDKEHIYLYEQFGSSKNYQDWINQIESYLLRLLRFTTLNKSLYDYLNHIFLTEGYGNSIQGLADKLGISVRHFNRLVNKEVGFSPSEFIRIHRFNSVLSYFEKADKISLTKVAHKFGYYDQSHFNHEFKLMSLQTPREYLKTRAINYIYHQDDNSQTGGFLSW